MGEQARLARIGDVIDRGAGRRAHVRDEQSGAVDPHLAAAGAIDVADEFGVA